MKELTRAQMQQVAGGYTKPVGETKPPYAYPKPPVIPFK